ncbi:MAG TPA: PilC/PilY family type IV pilus protein, partial [Steroidobacteraceae bacterium]|nr:PilC/PilY family type IV pilus protein [Steroidobacteraceae bacterium]
GGSLGYSCSNSNFPHDGLVGAYLGLGIDEYGNFLNGTSNTLGVSNPQSLGDNTASGGGQYAGRIGLRGSGSISWAYLTSTYGTNPSNNSLPYYPSSLATTCPSGQNYNSSGTCSSCSSGANYNSSNDTCYSCSSGTYNSSNQTCTVLSCSSGATLVGNSCHSCTSPAKYNTSLDTCNTCPSGYTYKSTTNNCTKSGSTSQAPTVTAPNAATPTTTTPAASSANPTHSSETLATLAVRDTCSSGVFYNFSTGSEVSTNTSVQDYPAIPGAWTLMNAVGPIANESATTRTNAVPIVYNLKITQDGLLSLSYSYNGGATTQVITNQSIKASNGPLPASFRFGFAGSTGGSSNIHEIVCFKATPVQYTNSSGSVNVYQNPELKTDTTQEYAAFYFPSDWTGQLTANPVGYSTSSSSIVVNTVPNWDARCVLTGVDSTTGKCSTGVATQTAEAPTSRVMLTWSGSQGIPFEWASLTTTQQSALNAGSTLNTPQDRLNYLRGDRTNELKSNGTGEFRARDSVLGDIINSSPTWVGPPQTYLGVTKWIDSLYPTATMPEAASTAQTYTAFQSAYAGRTNVVYAGANDGFLHGFRAGTLDSNGYLVLNSSSQPNDGYEILAYMPGWVVNTIHPVDSNGNVIAGLDYSNPQYGHNYYVDATPATGDVFYGGKWHTWLVGGLGSGGPVIYALNVTDPSSFSESNAAYNGSNDSGVVIGEWNPSTITCSGTVTACGPYLGNTFGMPQIRRFHNGQWGAIIGNGGGSAKGTAGIFIMLINNDGTVTFYYLPVSSTSTGNGIYEAASLDIDLDHVVDYIYGGDLLGNVWRFDVTSQDPTKWAVSASSPLFSAGSGQPITTRVTVGTIKTINTTTTLAGVSVSTVPERVEIAFGTGMQIPQTLNAATQYASGQQYLYGVWDWDMGTQGTAGSGWNALSAGQQAISLTSQGAQTISLSNMVQQTVTKEVASTQTQIGYRNTSRNTICWKGDSNCSGGTDMGWYMALPDTGEQVIYDPVLSPSGEFTVNTFVPASSSILSCNQASATGWAMGLLPDSGAGSPTPFFYVNGSLQADGIQLNGTGTPSFLRSGQAADNNADYLITQTANGSVASRVNESTIVTGQRLNWIQRR